MSRRKLPHELKIGRRSLLRGALVGTAATLALPTLEAMLNDNGDALANGEPLPRRFVTWMWGQGCRLQYWTPQTQGPDWAPSEELQPLIDAGMREYITVLTGFRNYVAGRRGHHDGMAGLFSGYPFVKLDPMGAPYASKFGGPSVDQVAADHMGGGSFYKSLQIGVSKRHLTSQGPTLETMSHRGPDQPLMAIRSPEKVYQKLFGALQGADDPEDVLRASALNAVMLDAQRLQSRVSTADQQRIEAHLESVFELQKQIAVIPTSCDLPSKPDVEPYKPDGAEPLWEINDVMSQMVVLAMRCDLCRVFSYMFTGASGACQFDMLTPEALGSPGSPDYSHADHHQISHNGNEYEQYYIHRSVIVTMENFAHFLQLLRNTEDGDGNLLDNTCILAGSDVTEAVTHSEHDYPIIIAGHAGGRLKTDVGHYRSTTEESLSNVGMACLKAVVPNPDSITEYGGNDSYYQGLTTEPTSVLLA